MKRTHTAARWAGCVAPISVGLLAVAYVMVRANWTVTPDGDPALHLRLIKDVASTGALPAELPYIPARVEEGGRIAAMFPYSYPPLYHALGAAAYKAAGIGGVLGLNALSAAVIALSLFAFISRRLPALAAGAVSLVFLTAPAVIGPFRSPYMEPVMLAFLFAGAWMAYLASTTRQFRFALLSGVLLGLGLATRQNALFIVLAIGIVLALSLIERGAWRPSRMRRELAWVVPLIAAGLVTAGPALLYLTLRSGGIGYADNWLPGMNPSLAVDATANGYIADITKPDGSAIVWLDRYRSILVYTESWAAEWLSLAIVATSMCGVAVLHSRPGAGRFLARWMVAQVAIDAAMLVTLHGNERYVIASQILFHTAFAVGLYAVVVGLARWVRQGFGATRLFGAGAVATLLVGVFYGLAPHSEQEFNRYLRTGDRDLRNFRGAQYAEMGAWVNENTAPDALILTPRTYTAALTWKRNVAWVTFYGNAWVIDAIEASEDERAHEILDAYGIDYVLVSDPTGMYIDAIPADGMRSYLQLNKSSPYFELVYATTSQEDFATESRVVEHGLRLYQVTRNEEASRAPD